MKSPGISVQFPPVFLLNSRPRISQSIPPFPTPLASTCISFSSVVKVSQHSTQLRVYVFSYTLLFLRVLERAFPPVLYLLTSNQHNEMCFSLICLIHTTFPIKKKPTSTTPNCSFTCFTTLPNKKKTKKNQKSKISSSQTSTNVCRVPVVSLTHFSIFLSSISLIDLSLVILFEGTTQSNNQSPRKKNFTNFSQKNLSPKKNHKTHKI